MANREEFEKGTPTNGYAVGVIKSCSTLWPRTDKADAVGLSAKCQKRTSG